MDFKRIKNELLGIFKSLEASSDKTWTKEEIDIKSEGVGGKVELINTDGTFSPITDGDYTMDSGNVFTVKDGVITKWNGETEAPVEEEAEMAEPETEEAPVEEPAKEDSADKVAEMQAEIDSLKTSIEEIKTMIGSFSSKEDVTACTAQIEKLTAALKASMSIPVETTQTSNSFTIKKSQEQKFNGLSQALAELKNK